MRRVRLVDKAKVERVERWIEKLALDGKIGAPLTEQDIVGVLSKQSDAAKVTIARKKRAGESDDEDDDDDLR